MTRAPATVARRPMFAAAVLVALAAAGARAAPGFDSADALLACMRANLPPTLRIEQIQLTYADRAGHRRLLQGTLYAEREHGLLRTMIHIDAPGDLAGSSYLGRETADGQEIYLYLPALNRVRRIVGAGVNGALFGTDLSYADVRQLENAFSGAHARLEGGGTLDGRSVERLLLSPRPGEASRYDLIRAWVDRQTCVALKVDFEAGGKPVKQLTAPARALRQSDGYWYLERMQLHDLEQGTSTELRVLGVQSGGKLPSPLFDRNTFYLGGGM
ncbi:MAG: outer membrane lipoprotein-sorting protein [Gammaproteobacteria bacterium]|nr:outer membrane lipoprotein-sorting protein [Gammaproteobacteria bacterium]